MVTIPFDPGGTDPGQIKRLVYQAASKAPSVHYSLPANTGIYAYEAFGGGVNHGRTVQAGKAARDFDYNAFGAGLAHGYVLAADKAPRDFDYAAFGAGLVKASKVTAATASYALLGADANTSLTPNLFGLAVLPGRLRGLSYQSGTSLEFVPKVVAAEPGTFSLVGAAATLQKAKSLAAGSADYAYEAFGAGLVPGTVPEPAPYLTWTLSGQIRRLVYQVASRPVFSGGKSVIAGTGAYALDGKQASLAYGGGFFLFGSSLIPGNIRGLVYRESSEPPSVPPAPIDDVLSPPLRTRNLIVRARFAAPNLFKAVAAASGAYLLSGTQAATGLGRRTVADSSASFYSLAGTAIALPRTRKITAGAASYGLVGSIAIPGLPHQLIGDIGLYQLAGQTAQTLWGRKPTAGPATYALTGTAVLATKLRAVLASSGAYQLTGTTAALVEKRKLVAETAAYEYLGQAASGLVPRSVHVTVANYSLNGAAANSIHGLRIAAATGALPLAGANVATFGTPAHSIIAVPASYPLNGFSVTLGHSWYLTEPDIGDYPMVGYGPDRLFKNWALQAFDLDDNDEQIVPNYELGGLPPFTQHNRVVDAVRGALVLGGSSVVIRQPARISAGAGAYALEGFDAIPRTGVAALASGGTYALAGSDADLTYRRTVVAQTAYLPLVGNGVRVRKAGPVDSLLFNERTINVPAILRETSVRRDQDRMVRVLDERLRQ